MAIWRAFWKQVDSLCDPLPGAACLLLFLLISQAATPKAGMKLFAISVPARTAWTQLHTRTAQLCPLRLVQSLRFIR